MTMTIPAGLKIVTYGGGVNTIAGLVLLRRLGVVPQAIVMSDPGHEWKATTRYLDEVARPWLQSVGFPDVVVVSRQEEGRQRAGFLNAETLGGLCERTSSLPSIAYGWKKCSFNYKTAPSLWWTERQPWAQAQWNAAEKLVKVIGYDTDEPRRIRAGFNDPVEDRRYVPWYPLFDAGMDRDDCVTLIASEGLPVPKKSACTFCPSNTVEEWSQLRREEPEAFEYAVAMSRRAESTIESSDVVGLMRCHPHGKRQLHLWVDGGYEAMRETESETPCECAL